MSRYIDADKLLIRFMDYICHDFACRDCKARYYPSGVCRVDKMLREFPTADVKPVVRGEWIEDGAVTKCSVCGNSSDYCGTENFCNYCGADMRSRLQGTEIDGMYIDISGDGTVVEQI